MRCFLGLCLYKQFSVSSLRKKMASLLITIRGWLMEPHVWRFVGLASTVVGLSCYALSSSFNHLFGRWKLWKIFVYSVFSIIICLLILFAKVWQGSRSRKFKARIACLVLIITSVYSFFLDQAVGRKPDAYSPISSAAFAVVFLSLSRQTDGGFEVDLLYYFSGALIIQLMEIKLLLGVIGVVFSSSLILLGYSLGDPNEHLRIKDEYHLALPVDLDSQEATALVMPQLTACLEALKSNNMQLIDMLSEYVKEFTEPNPNSNYKYHIRVDNNLVIDALQSDIIDTLHEAVKLLLAAGFKEECCKVYSNYRRKYLEECMYYFRLKLPNVVHKKTLEFWSLELIEHWITTSCVAMRLLFPNEKRLCERVFSGFTTAADLAFTNVCREFTIQQLNFASSFADGTNSIYLFHNMVEIFQALHDLIPDYESLFSEPSSDSIRKEAINTRKKLGKATNDEFEDVKKFIFRIIPGKDFVGQLHPISRFMMKRLCSIHQTWNSNALEEFFKEHPMVTDGEGTSSSFSTQFTMILELLDSQLEVKSANCTDPARRYLFMMNNRRSIEQMTTEYQLRTIFQDGMIGKLNAKVKRDLEDYRRSSWEEVIRLLKEGGDEPEAAELMKENLKLFDMHFKEICRVQSTWSVLDEQLRKEIIESIKEMFWPAYGNFVRKFKDILGSHAYEYIKFSMFDIEDLLDGLFRGKQLWNPWM